MKSISPRRIASLEVSPLTGSTYRTSVNPSARSSSSATYTGAPQIGVPLNKRTEVVSGGPSAATRTDARPKQAAPARERVERKQRRVCKTSIGSLPTIAFSHVRSATGKCESRLPRRQVEHRSAADLEPLNMTRLAVIRCLEMDVDVAGAGCKDTAM